MKYLILCLALVGSITAQAQSEPRGLNAVSVTAGSNEGGLTLGAIYDRWINKELTIGGHLREFSKDNSVGAPGYVMIGVQGSAHFIRHGWDFSLSPGFDIINISPAVSNRDTTTTLGPSLGLGALYQINPMWAVGFENARYWVWLDHYNNGEVYDDMSVRVRISF